MNLGEADDFYKPTAPGETPLFGHQHSDLHTIHDVPGVIYCGDNLDIMRTYIPRESVDLIYLDPPFNSQRTYNLLHKGSEAQEEAFKDFWSWEEAAPTFAKVVVSAETPKPLRTMLNGLHDLLIDNDSDLLAYLAMMTARLAWLHRVLKPTGSLYLHCDPTASHYLKMVLDAIFRAENFKNEVIWRRFSAKNDPNRYGRVHDSILFYTKSDSFCWHPQRMPVEEYSINKNFTADDDGRRYTLVDLTASKPGGDVDYEWHGVRPYKGRHWAYSKENMDRMFEQGLIVLRRTGMPRLKRYLDEQPGTPLQDLWMDIKLATASKERTGYPTQKPIDLLKRIIMASSNRGDLVLDPFCGCGTTVEAADSLGRRWIGIDIARKAIKVIENRFQRAGLDPPTVIWHPADKEAAEALAERDKHQFEEWAIRMVGAARLRKKDRGVDGEATFKDADGCLRHIVVSVKGGHHLPPMFMRELRGTFVRDGADIAVFVCVHEPSKEVRIEATRAGYLHVSDAEGPIPRIQIVTIDRIFSDLPKIRVPGVNVTDMPKPSVPRGKAAQLSLALDPASVVAPLAKGRAKPPPKPLMTPGPKKTSARPPPASEKKREAK